MQPKKFLQPNTYSTMRHEVTAYSISEGKLKMDISPSHMHFAKLIRILMNLVTFSIGNPRTFIEFWKCFPKNPMGIYTPNCKWLGLSSVMTPYGPKCPGHGRTCPGHMRTHMGFWKLKIGPKPNKIRTILYCKLQNKRFKYAVIFLLKQHQIFSCCVPKTWQDTCGVIGVFEKSEFDENLTEIQAYLHWKL